MDKLILKHRWERLLIMQTGFIVYPLAIGLKLLPSIYGFFSVEEVGE
jgi:hypothetical protein